MGEFQQQRATDQLGNIQATLVNIRVALEGQTKAVNTQNEILAEFLKEYKLQGFERRPKPKQIFCCFCGIDLTGLTMVGAGDGNGRKFACRACAAEHRICNV